MDANPALSLSADRLTVNGGSADWASVRATVVVSSGAWYWETTYDFAGDADLVAGVGTRSVNLHNPPGAGSAKGSFGAADRTGDCYENWLARYVWANIGPIASGVVIRHWLDYDAGVYRVAANDGPWAENGHIGGKALVPMVGLAQRLTGSGSVTANFGQAPFAFAVPPGANPGVYADDPILGDGFDAPAE